MTSGLLGHNTKKHSTLLSPKLTYFHIVKRSIIGRVMAYNARAGGIAQLGRVSIPKRGMACLVSGRLKKKLGPTIVDDSGKHKIVVETSCTDAKCLQQNCANPSNEVKCAYQNPQQNPQDIPASGGPAGMVSKVVGNWTSHIPPNTPGCVVDDKVNYDGQTKRQEMVIANKPHIVQNTDFKVDPKSTAYAQQQKHHENIMNALHPNKNDTQ